MKLPKLPDRRGAVQRQLVTFGGINYGEGAGDGELAESEGLSASGFPCLSQREGREFVRQCDSPNGIFAWGDLIIADGTTLLYLMDVIEMGRTAGDITKEFTVVGTVSDTPKDFAVVNTKLCIWPDKKCLDLTSKEFYELESERKSVAGTETSFLPNCVKIKSEAVYGRLQESFLYYVTRADNGPIQAGYHSTKRYDSVEWNTKKKAWTLTGMKEVQMGSLRSGDLVMLRKSEVSGVYALNTEGTYYHEYEGTAHNPVYSLNDDNGYYGIVTSVDVEDTTAESGFASSTYTTVWFHVLHKMEDAPELSTFFQVNDKVDITGAKNEKNNVKLATIEGISDADGTITFKDGTFVADTQTEEVTITRTIPDLDFICEHDNRLWGVSNKDKTIYASALGNPSHFYDYDGTNNDSYAVAVGTDGDFTGCIAYSGNVLCFKERCLHKVMGDLPKEHAIITYNIEGVQRDSHRSMEIINEVLYYKGRNGVYAYTGGTPVLVSTALGQRRFERAAAGTDGVRYYISMRDMGAQAGEGWGLYAYDTQNRLWLREDATHAVDFTNLDGVLHILDAGGKAVLASRRDSGETVAWTAQFAPFFDDVTERKRNLRLLLRLELDEGATVQVETREDRGPWRRVWSTGNSRNGSCVIPIFPKRCDRFSLRLSGKGRCLVRSITREFQVGSWV